uniref:Carbonic anhydrase 4 n=1 Tax=Malurus cyaneus samueli TaxID=2593467 RepID=A0A8C5X8Q3_9PASS
MELLLLALFSLHILKTEAVVGGHWCYQSQKCEQPLCEDPAQWHQINAACKGSRQSPVNIVTQNVVYNKSLTPLTFEGYDVKGSAKWDVENNGHTGKYCPNLLLGDGAVTSPKVGGGGLRRKYKAVEFHLHWGVPGEPQHIPGSEHSIDGEKYPMEVGETASKQNPDGLAVLAFFVKVGREIFNCPPQIVGLRDCVNVTAAHNLSLPIFCRHSASYFFHPSLHPARRPWRYYRYEGFLTTPDCYEGVIWTIFETPIELSERQSLTLSQRLYLTPYCCLERTVFNNDTDTVKGIKKGFTSGFGIPGAQLDGRMHTRVQHGYKFYRFQELAYLSRIL